MTSNHYYVFARRFRPQTFSAVLGQDAIVKTMKNGLKFHRIAHAYLFSGSRGTGKTSLARLFAKAINCLELSDDYEPCNKCISCQEITEGRSLDILEIDGASHRGIDDIRMLSDSVSYAPVSGKYKIYLIDEVHMLTKEAFNALLKTLEEPPPHVLFFFATTEPHKVLPTIVSRCQRFQLKRISSKEIVQKLTLISKEVGITVEKKALERLASYADGGLRDAESMFDQIVASCSEGIVTESDIQSILGLSPIEWFSKIDRAIETVCYSTAFEITDALFLEGKDIGYFIQDLLSYYAQFLKNSNLSHPYLTSDEIVAIIELITKAHIALKTAPSSKIILEWLITSIIQIRLKMPLSTIVKKLLLLENGTSSSLDQSTIEQKEPIQSPITETTQESCKKAPIVDPISIGEEAQRKNIPLPLLESQERARQESMMQFAAVEFESTLIKKNSK